MLMKEVLYVAKQLLSLNVICVGLTGADCQYSSTSGFDTFTWKVSIGSERID